MAGVGVDRCAAGGRGGMSRLGRKGFSPPIDGRFLEWQTDSDTLTDLPKRPCLGRARERRATRLDGRAFLIEGGESERIEC
jgi:hypothetical protein